MPKAVEHIRRMRGGAQSHLMRCEDGGLWVVKFQNNPQSTPGGRILVNELLGTRLAARMGLPTQPAEVVDVEEWLIRLSDDLVIHLGAGREPCVPGRQFGSRYPRDPAETTVHDFLPDEQLREVENLADFAGMLVFDKWTCNTNGRQAIFYKPPGRPRYCARMIDNGFCFNSGEWSFPDAPLRGIYARHRVYEGVTSLDSFEPWLGRLESPEAIRALDDIAREIPAEWYRGDWDALGRLLEQLDRRRKRVRELVLEAKHSSRQPFFNWR